jgi:hypothetical protein
MCERTVIKHGRKKQAAKLKWTGQKRKDGKASKGFGARKADGFALFTSVARSLQYPPQVAGPT